MGGYLAEDRESDGEYYHQMGQQYTYLVFMYHQNRHDGAYIFGLVLLKSEQKYAIYLHHSCVFPKLQAQNLEHHIISSQHLKLAPLELLPLVPLLVCLHWYPQQEHHLSLCLQGAMQFPFQPQEECLMIGLQQGHKLVRLPSDPCFCCISIYQIFIDIFS